MIHTIDERKDVVVGDQQTTNLQGGNKRASIEPTRNYGSRVVCVLAVSFSLPPQVCTCVYGIRQMPMIISTQSNYITQNEKIHDVRIKLLYFVGINKRAGGRWNFKN